MFRSLKVFIWLKYSLQNIRRIRTPSIIEFRYQIYRSVNYVKFKLQAV